MADLSSVEENDPQPRTSVLTETPKNPAKIGKTAVHHKTAKGKVKNTGGRNFHPKTFIPLSVEEPRPGDRHNVPSMSRLAALSDSDSVLNKE